MKSTGAKVPLESYLKRATGGLPRRARAEAQAELRSHVHERAHELQQSGSSPEAAELRAVQELGEARTVARSLQRSHHVHPVLSALALGILVTGAAWPVGLKLADLRKQQIDLIGDRVMLTDPGFDVTRLRWTGLVGWSWYRSFLDALGIGISGRGLNAQLHRAGYLDVPVVGPSWMSSILMYERASDWQLGRDLYNTQSTVDALVAAGWPVKIELNAQPYLQQTGLSLNGYRLDAGQWSKLGTEATVLGAVSRTLDTLKLPHDARKPQAGESAYRTENMLSLHPDAAHQTYSLPVSALPVESRPWASHADRLYVLAVRDTDLYDMNEIPGADGNEPPQRLPVIRLSLASVAPGGGMTFSLSNTVKQRFPMELYPNAQAWGEAPVPLLPSSAERPAILIEVQLDLSALAHSLKILPLGGQLKPQIRP